MDGTLYIVGGWSGGSSKSIELIDPIQQRWLKYGPEMKQERYQFAITGVTFDNQLMVLYLVVVLG